MGEIEFDAYIMGRDTHRITKGDKAMEFTSEELSILLERIAERYIPSLIASTEYSVSWETGKRINRRAQIITTTQSDAMDIAKKMKLTRVVITATTTIKSRTIKVMNERH